jgi:rod shape-determining protein MreD
MKQLKLGVWIVLLLLFQTTISRYISVGGIFPDVTFVFIICFAVLEEKFSYNIIIPVVCGALIDLLGDRAFGINVVAYSCSALICYGIGEQFFKQKLGFALPMVFVFSLLCESLFFLLHFAVLKEVSFVSSFVSVILPMSVYNAVVTLVIYPLLKLTVYRNQIQ